MPLTSLMWSGPSGSASANCGGELGPAGIWQALLRRAFRGWRLDECEDLAACFSKHMLLYEVVAEAVRVATFNIRKIIAAAKDKFLRSLAADGTQDVASIMQRAKKAGVGSKARKPVGRDLPKLLDPASGAPATSTAERDSIWLRYFGDQEAGSVLPTTEFLAEAAVSIDHVVRTGPGICCRARSR